MKSNGKTIRGTCSMEYALHDLRSHFFVVFVVVVFFVVIDIIFVVVVVVVLVAAVVFVILSHAHISRITIALKVASIYC